ncbi:MAG: nitroreductase family protein, partial [Acidimicrobiia bacterium]|nr:nitroreductase family protein [Acidimicrobiia bacterium]
MTYPTVPYRPRIVPDDERIDRARQVYTEMDTRRSVRDFSDRPVPREMLDLAIAAASTAPSGAHMQPWTFVVTGDPEVK